MKGKIGPNSPGFILLNAWNWVALCKHFFFFEKKKRKKKEGKQRFLWLSLEFPDLRQHFATLSSVFVCPVMVIFFALPSVSKISVFIVHFQLLVKCKSWAIWNGIISMCSLACVAWECGICVIYTKWKRRKNFQYWSLHTRCNNVFLVVMARPLKRFCLRLQMATRSVLVKTY